MGEGREDVGGGRRLEVMERAAEGRGEWEVGGSMDGRASSGGGGRLLRRRVAVATAREKEGGGSSRVVGRSCYEERRSQFFMESATAEMAECRALFSHMRSRPLLEARLPRKQFSALVP